MADPQPGSFIPAEGAVYRITLAPIYDIYFVTDSSVDSFVTLPMDFDIME
jgi:hypothetical protein